MRSFLLGNIVSPTFAGSGWCSAAVSQSRTYLSLGQGHSWAGSGGGLSFAEAIMVLREACAFCRGPFMPAFFGGISGFERGPMAKWWLDGKCSHLAPPY